MTKSSRRICIALVAVALTASCARLPWSSAQPEWHALAFGQSVDVNFATSVLPAKVGTNNVWLNGKKLSPGKSHGLDGTITIESRGGKIANTHDGLTFYYTRLPVDQTFVLEADVTVEQFGPEIEAAPNAQEAVGLMVRDGIGQARQEPLQEGYEEFPAASNMAVNAVVTKERKRGSPLNLQSIYREGVDYPWGNPGAVVIKDTYADVEQAVGTPFRLKLERTNKGFISTYAKADGTGAVSKAMEGANANIVQHVDARYMYVGFFAARNARVTFRNAKLTTTKASIASAPFYVMPAIAPTLEIASSDVSAADAYLLQARASVAGRLSITQDGKPVGTDLIVTAGTLFARPLSLGGASSRITLSFVPAGVNAKPLTREVTVKRKQYADAASLYAAADGKADAAGTREAPLDVATAIKAVAQGGTVYLLDGTYGSAAITLDIGASGSEGKLKKLVAANPGKVILTKALTIEASYWHLKDIEVSGVTTGNGIRISGSHNMIEGISVHGSSDTGLQITAGPGFARSVWPSHNLVLNSESYDNMDAARKNADGFAAKIGVGDGNVFRGCISHNNVDDGWDLFNKIEDDSNGVVIIENSVSYENGITYTFKPPVGSIGNGFKLGGEGLPVAHVIRNSIAFNNNMDGFSDNFNPGALKVSNNIAFNNARFNYIFRAGPFVSPQQQGRFDGNLSLRTSKATYSDALVGVVDPASNYFYDARKDKSENVDGKSINAADFVSIAPPVAAHRLQRDANGNIVMNGFLQRK